MVAMIGGCLVVIILSD